MQELWSSASYEAHLLSLPFALAPAAMLIVIAYAAVMRGSPTLRLWLLGHCLSLLPYAVVMMLSPSITDGRVAEKGLTLVPLTLYFRGGRAKVELALARGKHRHDKRETIRRRESDRETQRVMRRHTR